MKKLLTAVATLALLAGCSSTEGTVETTPAAETPVATETPVASETPVETESAVETEAPAETEEAAATLDLSAVADGTYTGEATGMGAITVTLTVADGEITEAEVVGDGETDGIGVPVVESAPEEIVANQGYVEVVSGATITSEAINSAIDAALAQ